MGNVFQLFREKEIDNPSRRNTSAIAAAEEVVASSACLDRAIKELSRHFDAVNVIVDAFGDLETRITHKQSMQLSCETLTSAVLELSQQINRLPEIRQLGKERVTQVHSKIFRARGERRI